MAADGVLDAWATDVIVSSPVPGGVFAEAAAQAAATLVPGSAPSRSPGETSRSGVLFVAGLTHVACLPAIGQPTQLSPER